MERIKTVTIAGVSYPLNFSVKAAKQIGERYGDITEIGKAFEGNRMTDMLDEFVFLLSVLLEQGAAYRRVMDGVEVKTLSYDALSVIIGMDELMSMRDTILEAITAGMGREVEVEPDRKNEETTRREALPSCGFSSGAASSATIVMN